MCSRFAISLMSGKHKSHSSQKQANRTTCRRNDDDLHDNDKLDEAEPGQLVS